MNGEVDSYLTSLDRFFGGLKSSYEREKERCKKELSSFFEPLIFKYRVAKEIKKQTDKFLASDFNLLGIMSPDEDRISNVIAELLKTNGKHGQGEVFLQKFLVILSKELSKSSLRNFLDVEPFLNSRITVKREAETNGRVDIQITFEGERNFTIGIENKPWAGDQQEQLKRYSDYLRRKYRDYILLFISGSGRLPSDFSIPEKERKKLEEEGRLLCTSYRRFLIPWLRECLRDCEAEKVRWFLRDFITWIEKNFQEEVNDG